MGFGPQIFVDIALKDHFPKPNQLRDAETGAQEGVGQEYYVDCVDSPAWKSKRTRIGYVDVVGDKSSAVSLKVSYLVGNLECDVHVPVLPTLP